MSLCCSKIGIKPFRCRCIGFYRYASGLDVNLSIDPYLLGVLIGDGGLSAGSIRVSNPDEFILEKI